VLVVDVCSELVVVSEETELLAAEESMELDVKALVCPPGLGMYEPMPIVPTRTMMARTRATAPTTNILRVIRTGVFGFRTTKKLEYDCV
jgi:hypothetical protein